MVHAVAQESLPSLFSADRGAGGIHTVNGIPILEGTKVTLAELFAALGAGIEQHEFAELHKIPRSIVSASLRQLAMLLADVPRT